MTDSGGDVRVVDGLLRGASDPLARVEPLPAEHWHTTSPTVPFTRTARRRHISNRDDAGFNYLRDLWPVLVTPFRCISSIRVNLSGLIRHRVTYHE